MECIAGSPLWPRRTPWPGQAWPGRSKDSIIRTNFANIFDGSGQPRCTVGGVPSKRLIWVSTMVIVREYHNQRYTSGLKGYAARRATTPRSVWWLLWHFAANLFPRSCPLFIKVTHRVKVSDVVGLTRCRIFILQRFRDIVTTTRQTFDPTQWLVEFFFYFTRFDRFQLHINLQIGVPVSNVSIELLALCFVIT